MTQAAGRMSPRELDELLRRPILARLATVGADGYPVVVPVWIEWDGVAAWIVARARARFVGDLRRDPRVCLSVVADDDPDRRAQLFGRAEIVEDAAPLDGRALAIARRMALRYEGPAGVEYVERSRAWERVLVRLVPERTVSWTSGEWHARYIPDAERRADPPDAARSNP